MAYVNEPMKVTLTTYGKEQGLKYGLLSIVKYFTIHDTGVIYSKTVKPDHLLDINGLHGSSTNATFCDDINIINK